jgi:NAD(P)-dependent dehydrogenase (short-subunit alcohol dehydrogenase family)
VIVHGRDPERLERTVAELGHGSGQDARGYLADLSSIEETRALARQVTADSEHLDVLVCNAGIITTERRLSADGVELTFAVNYLSHFLLTLELLPLLRAGEKPRIVNVASIGQEAIDFDDVMLERGYSSSRSYSQSKLAQIMFTFELAERLGFSPTVTALHPATWMDTKMVRGMGVRPTSSVSEGLEATLRLATDDDVEGITGEYFNGTEAARADPQAYDPEARRRLWELSAELTGAGR